LYKNGSSVANSISELYTPSSNLFRNDQLFLGTTLDLVATDYIEVYGRISGSSTLDFGKIEFGGFRIII
jgi:hypothetical protein